MLDLNNMRKQIKRALCKHDYNTIAMHKWARANLWKYVSTVQTVDLTIYGGEDNDRS